MSAPDQAITAHGKEPSGIRTHVEMLHDLAAGIDGVLVSSTYYANSSGGTITHHPVGDVDGMVAAIEAHLDTPGANSYIGLQVMRRGLQRGKRGTEADIVAVLGLVADMDGDTGNNSGEYPLPPNYIVESSAGNLQAFWLFDRPVTPAVAKEIAAGLQVATASDHCTKDITHVWRVPGTLNHPNTKKLERGRSPEPQLVRVAQEWDGTFTDPTALALAVAGRGASTLETNPVELGELPSVDGIEVSERAAEKLARNLEPGEDRSGQAYAVVEQLHFDGHTAEEAAALFVAATGNWTSRYRDEEHMRGDFSRMWGKREAEREKEREQAARFAEGLSKPANDNHPSDDGPAKKETSLDIFAWPASSFVGDAPDPVYLVDGVIETGIPVILAAQGEVGKSFLQLELARRVAFGCGPVASPILGGRVAQEGTAVFLTGEDDRNALHRRLASLDTKQARYTERGDKLLTVPLPSAAKSVQPFWTMAKGELKETDAWKRFCDQLDTIDDLRLVIFEPLQLLASVPLNEDPAAGQFVTASMSQLAAHTGATVLTSHHMGKAARHIASLADARDAIRGTSALVDGVRLAYALWYGDEEEAKRVCRASGTPYAPNRVVKGGVVKANGAARRLMSTYIRNESGLLVDKTAQSRLGGVEQGDLLGALIVTVQSAAEEGHPFKKTGRSGLFEQQDRLPDELRGVGKHRIHALVDEALAVEKIVRASAKGEKVADWLDVPGGPFAIGLGTFTVGAAR